VLFLFPRLDNYEWCGSSTYATSGWEEITNDFSGIQVASYMSEYGFVTFLSLLLPSAILDLTLFHLNSCITNPPRLWQEVPVLYSQPVTNVFSGGVAFSYFPTADGYGMVTFTGSDGQTWVNGSVEVFQTLS
jgi:1,3-beta-glucanosyltransferase GAS1